ncbi:MAG: hypothetical protein IPM61_08405 [Chlorobi bacterium]|nr:MAG: hypothetical protein UZ07_CHB004003421 [Chlorobi bacterium OLB7]MBK8911341.1 hypothetical protein [Chlorobiota bacterium]MBX7217719.1 hypothetical protein [Candidatus Kapabacteria bacterium]
MKQANVLLVEGHDDLHCLVGLIKAWAIPLTVTGRGRTLVERDDAVALIEIREKGGWEKLRDTLDVELDASDLQRLGILVDANGHPDRRYQSLQEFFQKHGYGDFPSKHDALPAIVDHAGKPRIGIWLMPNNTDSGTLEDFLRMLIPEPNTLWSRAETCVGSIPAEERLFSESDRKKAVTHTYLAWQKQPGNPFGIAVSSGAFNPQAAAAQKLRDWFTQLFMDPLPQLTAPPHPHQ